MNITISPTKLRGTVCAIPSKSQAHRLLICSAFADGETTLLCPATNRDIEATADCLRALGADIEKTETGYRVAPIQAIPAQADLYCCESGSTLRFLLPIAGALGVDARFHLEGRLPQRPLSPLWEEMERMGCTLSRPCESVVRCQGKLKSGSYHMDGSVSSQFITGLLFALALLPEDSTLTLSGRIESRPYLQMTVAALRQFQIDLPGTRIPGNQIFHTPGILAVEGDWSNAAFFLAANALGSQISVTGLDPDSPQGDRACAGLLNDLQKNPTISAANIPDLVPILAVAAGASSGAVFKDAARLRLKESDRLESVAALLRALGGTVTVTQDGLIVRGTGYRGGTVDAASDHRIAMAAAIAATVCTEPVTILGADCVKKSYPDFWDVYQQLGGVLL